MKYGSDDTNVLDYHSSSNLPPTPSHLAFDTVTPSSWQRSSASLQRALPASKMTHPGLFVSSMNTIRYAHIKFRTADSCSFTDGANST